MSEKPTQSASEHRRRSTPRRMLLAACLLACGVAAYYGFWRYHLKRFSVVRAGVLYRTAQPTELGIRHLIHWHGVKTVLNARLEDPILYRGLIDTGRPDGQRESEFVARLGARHVQWPIGAETYWPWLTPWQFEEFYRLFDDPESLPVAVHCVGGRHRTGTFTALYQLEYERLPVETVLRQMYSYEFGQPAWIHEHNLRTYLPRPRPTRSQCEAMAAALLPGESRQNWDELVRLLRASRHEPTRQQRLRDYIRGGQPFALCLAQRLLDDPGEPLAAVAAEAASRTLQQAGAGPKLSAAAALVADYGTPQHQAVLYRLLEDQPRAGLPDSRYQAIVAGVTNRYTPNRIAYLRPLLDDRRLRPEPAARRYRYCDTAVARLASILNEPLLYEGQDVLPAWNDAVQRAAEWFAEDAQRLQLVQLCAPTGKNEVRDERSALPDLRGEVRR